MQTNSSTAEESATASEELASQAELLKNMVNRFRLKTIKNSGSYMLGDELRENAGTHEEAGSDDSKTGGKHKLILVSDAEFGKY